MPLLPTTLILVATLGASFSPNDVLAEKLLPAIDYASKEPKEWLAELQAGGGRSRDALWCLFHSYREGAVPEATIATLREYLERTSSSPIRRDLETILTQWKVSYSLESEAEDHPGGGEKEIDEELAMSLLPVEREDVFLVPLEDSKATTAELHISLESTDPRAQATAAIELGLRRENVEQVVRQLVASMNAAGEPGGDGSIFWLLTFGGESRIAVPLECARGYALSRVLSSVGSAAADALLEIVADSELEEELRRCALTSLLHTSGDGWLESLARFEQPTDEMGDEIEQGLLRTLARRARYPLSAADERPSLAERLLVEKLVSAWSAGDADVELVEFTGQAGAHSVIVRERLRPQLIAHLTGGDPLERFALYWLANWGHSGQEIRAAYLRVLGATEPDAGSFLKRLPLLRDHDEDTLAALRRVFEAADDKTLFIEPLGCAVLLDAETEPMIRTLLAALPMDDHRLWRQAFQAGFEAKLAHDPQAAPDVQPFRLGITIRAARSAGRDFESERRALLELLHARDEEYETSHPPLHAVEVIDELQLTGPEFIDWSLGVLADDWIRDSDLHWAVARSLIDVELSFAQRARLYHLDLPEEPEVEYLQLLARQGSGAIEWAGALRRLAEEGYLIALNYALEMARFGPRDERILIGALADTDTDGRLVALEIVAEHHLDTPALRLAIAGAREDGDE
jgi:hypothetical protein